MSEPEYSPRARSRAPRYTPQVVTLLALFSLVTLTVAFGDERAVILDKAKVYYGKVKDFSSPSTINRKKVYAVIPSWKKIKDENIKKSDARYHFLLKEASNTFRKYVKKVAVEKGYDLVAEKSAIKVTGKDLPDITKVVIKKIKAQK